MRGVIRDLIAEGLLEYHYTFGQSYIIGSFRKPVRVATKFVIVPPDYTGKVPHGCHPIAIAPGAAFGYEQHLRMGIGQRPETFRAGLERASACFADLLG